jgi:hypothetical protein
MLNECIILPGFGGFETHYLPAQYDNRHKRMLPPTKKVHFRADYLKGGEALEDHLCKHLHIKHEQAKLLIDEYVTVLNQRLAENREAIIGGVGLFTLGLGDNLSFTAFEEENYLAESFGLEAFPFSQPEKAAPKVYPQKELKIRSRSNTLYFVVLGIVVISVLMAITVFISSKFDLYLFNIGDSSAQNDLIIIGNITDVDTSKKLIDSTIEESTNLKKALYYSESLAEKPESVSKIYYLVAGSFKTYKNAEVLEKKMIDEGYLPQIIDNNGYYRVSIANFSNKKQALKELQRLRRQLDRSVWLLTVSNPEY